MTKRKLAKDSGPDLHWVPASGGYSLALDGDRVVARSASGSVLKSMPSTIRDDPAVENLRELRDWLDRHEKECVTTVETWMVRSLPIPTGVIKEVWRDPAWEAALRDAVVVPIDEQGTSHREGAGFLRHAEEGRGLGVVTLDGETRWLDPALITIPHPVLLLELDDFRDFATELHIEQSISQLYRETWPKPATLEASVKSIDSFAGGAFKQLLHATSRCRTLGYRVSGGYAVTRIWEDARLVEGRFWIGSDSPEVEAETGDLVWVESGSNPLTLGQVGPVAFSEGMRMAAAVYAGRFVDEAEAS